MPKTVPLRQCIGCREQKPTTELIRVVRSPEGELSIDLRGKSPGRGAYLCRSGECLKRAVKSRALERALAVPVPDDVWARLTAELEADDG